MLILLKVRVLWFCLAPIFETCFETLGPFIRGKIRRELYHLYEHVLSNKTRLAKPRLILDEMCRLYASRLM